ncbi:UNVERIFIED_CONTAM: hypothetical protein GTU68_052134 [Idotea baltica]|nr:hypothetical protein [Idotea baltica]
MQILHLLTSNTLIFYSISGLLGLVFGSFANVVIYRLPLILKASSSFSLNKPPSNCVHCKQIIRVWNNIPIISYLFLKGKCSYCKHSISFHYCFIELACMLLFIHSAWIFGPSWSYLAFLVFSWCLLTLSAMDISHRFLPDSIVFPLLWLGLITNSFNLFTTLDQALWGAIAGYLSLYTIYLTFKWVTGKEGMGFGDFKLFAVIGAWGGWQILPLTLLTASLAGAFIGLIAQKQTSKTIAFGPYLAISGWIAILWGNEITTHYLNFIR